MAAKLTRLTNKIAIQLRLMVENYTICSFRSRQPVRKLLDTPSCKHENKPFLFFTPHADPTIKKGLVSEWS